jgi:hypothetical protein
VVIDRSFYRRKYHAAKTVAIFGDTLRSEVDLSQLTGHLVLESGPRGDGECQGGNRRLGRTG